MPFTPSCFSVFPYSIIFLLPEEFLMSANNNYSQLCLYGNVFILPSHLKDIFTGYKIPDMPLPQHLKDVIPFSLASNLLFCQFYFGLHCFFSQASFKILFSNFIMKVFFVFFFFEVQRTFGTVTWWISSVLKNSCPLSFKYCFYPIFFHLLFLNSDVLYIRPFH